MYASGFQLKCCDGKVNADSMRELVDSQDQTRVIIGDPEDAINRNLRSDLRLFVSTSSKKLRLTHQAKRLYRGRKQSIAVGTVIYLSDDADDGDDP